MCSQGKTVRKGTWIPILAHIRLHLRALGIDGYDEERGMKSLLLPAANFFHNLLLAAETGLGFD